MLNSKKIVFTTGGTGGHINPALAVAGEIRRRYPEAEILFIGTSDRLELHAQGRDHRYQRLL